MTTPTDSAATWWHEHRAQLRRLVARRVADRHAVDDIVRTSCLKAHECDRQSIDAPAFIAKPEVERASSC